MMTIDMATQVAYWNRVSGGKRFSHPLRLEWLPPDKRATIVDYGCGYGRSLAELARAGYTSTIGIDFSAGMLARAHAEMPGTHLIHSDGHTLPLDDGSVACVLLFAFLTCIPDGAEQQRQIAEVKRVLGLGGLIYISDLLLNNDERNRARYEAYANRFGCYGVFELPEGVIVRHHSREWIDQLTAPFNRMRFKTFEVTTMNGNASAAFQYLGRKES